jgi:hypothetical protein
VLKYQGKAGTDGSGYNRREYKAGILDGSGH